MEKIKIVSIAGTRYQLKKLVAADGSYILFRMMGMLQEVATASANNATAKEPAETQPETSPEDKARVIVSFGMYGGKDYEFHKFVQQKAIAACSRMEAELPMPLMNDAGKWAIPEIRDNMGLVVRLATESLVFSLSDFFAFGEQEAK